jgi:hypothetical protein
MIIHLTYNCFSGLCALSHFSEQSVAGKKLKAVVAAKLVPQNDFRVSAHGQWRVPVPSLPFYQEKSEHCSYAHQG